jgi:MFS family permease
LFFPAAGTILDGIIAAHHLRRRLPSLGPSVALSRSLWRQWSKATLQLSLIMVGAATFLDGASPVPRPDRLLGAGLLVIPGFVQGFAVGGEWGGAVLLVAEHSPNESRGILLASWPQAAAPMGNLLATGVFPFPALGDTSTE